MKPLREIHADLAIYVPPIFLLALWVAIFPVRIIALWIIPFGPYKYSKIAMIRNFFDISPTKD